jgi:hypothetical protein
MSFKWLTSGDQHHTEPSSANVLDTDSVTVRLFLFGWHYVNNNNLAFYRATYYTAL